MEGVWEGFLEGKVSELACQAIGGAECKGSVVGLRAKVQRWGSAVRTIAMRSQLLPLKPPEEPRTLPEQESEQSIQLRGSLPWRLELVWGLRRGAHADSRLCLGTGIGLP